MTNDQMEFSLYVLGILAVIQFIWMLIINRDIDRLEDKLKDEDISVQ